MPLLSTKKTLGYREFGGDCWHKTYSFYKVIFNIHQENYTSILKTMWTIQHNLGLLNIISLFNKVKQTFLLLLYPFFEILGKGPQWWQSVCDTLGSLYWWALAPVTINGGPIWTHWYGPHRAISPDCMGISLCISW